MSNTTMPDAVACPPAPPRISLLGRLFKPFTDLAGSPRAIWYVIGAFVVDCTAYFGVLTLMTMFLGHDLHWGDKWAGIAVSCFTMLVTLSMLGIGSVAEALGLRRAIIIGLILTTVGRAAYCFAPYSPGSGLTAALVIVGLLIVACGSGILQPVCYSGVKQFTDAKTSSMGYAVIYAVMNLGFVGMGALSAWVRPAVQNVLDHPAGASRPSALPRAMARFSPSGVEAVNWLCTGLTALTLLVFLVLMTRRAEATRLRSEVIEADPNAPQRPFWARFRAYFADGPFSNTRFVFFVFMLLPVRTLFAHQWLTMPQYILRAYPKAVGDKMEWLVNWINPGIIFFGVPLLTAFTRRRNVYSMMMVGTLVSALPTFLLCFGPKLEWLITYFQNS